MKKLCQIAALFLCLSLAFINTGCDKEQDDNPVNPITPTLTTNPVSDKTVPIGCNDSISWETQGISSLVVKINGEMVSTLLKGSIKFSSITEEKIVEFEIPDNKDMNKTVRLMPQSISYPKPVITLSVNPDRLPQTGGNVTISWVTTNADSVLHNSVWYPAQGSISYNVTDTTTYQFTAQGIGGQTAGSITVYVETITNFPTFDDYLVYKPFIKVKSEENFPTINPDIWVEIEIGGCSLDDKKTFTKEGLFRQMIVDWGEDLCPGQINRYSYFSWLVIDSILTGFYPERHIQLLNWDMLVWTYESSYSYLNENNELITIPMIVRETYIH